MSREIKFRAWDKEHACFVNHTLFLTIGGEEPISGMTLIDEDLFVLQQYTGLKDKNGKEIYEGDIIQWSIDWRERKAEVKYGIGEFDGGVYKYAGFYLEGDGRILEPYEITNMIKHKEYYSYKVVGNIFEGVDK